MKRTLDRTAHAICRERKRGSASILAVFAMILVASMSAGMMMTAVSSKDERNSVENFQRAQSAADGGVAHALANLSAGNVMNIGTLEDPIPFAGGAYFVSVLPGLDDTYSVVSTGTYGGEAFSVEAVAAPSIGGVYNNGVFAGNDSGDPLYTLKLNGRGGQADDVTGDVYSGGDLLVTEDATVGGAARAKNVVTGIAGESYAEQPVPDLRAMNYETMAGVNVKDLFSAAEYRYDNAGGNAWQVPESNPAHIFRRNPSDRSTENTSTEKDDYYLEDPYSNVQVDRGQDGSDAYLMRLTNSADPAKDGNNKVYFIDGNLWLHSRRSYSFSIYDDDPDGVKVTFVVKGNIYFSDNLFYQDPEKDGVAFIAMEDPDTDDSGNIYFGDPEFGTLLEMNAFMYAENNFHDINLDASGSAKVRVNGNMSAGNQILIQRDWGDQHTQLVVDFDDRVMLGDLDMPGLPGPAGGDGDGRFRAISWRGVASPLAELREVYQ